MFEGISEPPVPSILRGFSAPVSVLGWTKNANPDRKYSGLNFEHLIQILADQTCPGTNR